MEIRRGDIVEVDFGLPVGSVQGGIRPAVVVQNDAGNIHSPTTLVMSVTSSKMKRSIPTHGELAANSGCGLDRDSTFTAEQIRTINKSQILRKFGHVTPNQMATVDIAVAISFGVYSYAANRSRLQGAG